MVFVTILDCNGVVADYRPAPRCTSRHHDSAPRGPALTPADASAGFGSRTQAAAHPLRVALAATELAVQFSRLCGQNCFELSYYTLLGAVRDCCPNASEETLAWLAAATGAGAIHNTHIYSWSHPYGLIVRIRATTGVRLVQLSVDHSFYEVLRWYWGHPDAVWLDHELVSPGMRPQDALSLLEDARRRQPDLEACTYRTSLRMCMQRVPIIRSPP